jgi:PIN domain nuclease of toxin-antitoxin system
MGNEFILDAHALVWFLGGNPRLGPHARKAIEDAPNLLYLPIIALAEACWAVAAGKTAIPSLRVFLGDVDADRRIIKLSAISEMHDRLIVASALYLAGDSKTVPLLTCDPDISTSGLVPVVW